MLARYVLRIILIHLGVCFIITVMSTTLMWIVSFTTLYFDISCHVSREIVFENWQLKFYIQDIDFMYLFFSYLVSLMLFLHIYLSSPWKPYMLDYELILTAIQETKVGSYTCQTSNSHHRYNCCRSLTRSSRTCSFTSCYYDYCIT